MKLRAAAALLLPLLFPFSLHASSGSEATPTPGIMEKTLELLHLKHSPHPKNPPQMHHQIEIDLGIIPSAIKLSQDREIRVTVSLYNRSKKYVDLNFPTSQRIEILVRDALGKVVNTWSEDQSFTNDPAAMTVNPGERLEYTALVATREMSAGRPYAIEASFPSYPELKVRQQVIPQK